MTQKVHAATRVQEGVSRPAPITVTVNGKPVVAYEGESIAAAVLAAGMRHYRGRNSPRPHAPFCNMGTCFECLVVVRDVCATPGMTASARWVRGCLTPVAAGLRIGTWVDGSVDTIVSK